MIKKQKKREPNPVGVATHPDHIETIEKELKSMAQYDEQLEMLKKYF